MASIKYNNMSVLGSTFKLQVHVDPIETITEENGKPKLLYLSDMNPICYFYTNSNNKIEYTLTKGLYPILTDGDSTSDYIAVINSEDIGAGTIKMTIKLQWTEYLGKVPINRVEIETVCTGVTIYPKEVC